VDIVYSVNGVPIRMTSERWFHIVENHDYLAGRYEDILDVVVDPDMVLQGYGGALIAVRGVARSRYLAVMYKEVSANDGFVISAYITEKVNRKAIVWKKNP
jgi:hypothetical protein